MSDSAPGTFVLSLDCEGKWGMADSLDGHHNESLTNSRLTRAYESLVQLLDRYEIDVTFAFVMAFLLRDDELERFDSLLVGDLGTPDSWLAHYREARTAGALEGWHLPEALQIVRSSGAHEIACHGFCHRPLGEDLIAAKAAATELAAAQEVADMRRIELRTLIFPRNEVGHLEQVRSAGFVGYRTALPGMTGLMGRAARTMQEFNIWRLPQQRMPVTDGLVPIPAGHFFNWRHGIRRIVPAKTTELRWRNLLRRASDGTVVHLWLHPHNLVTASDMTDALERVLADVAERRAAGSLRVMTQEQYCGEVLKGASA